MMKSEHNYALIKMEFDRMNDEGVTSILCKGIIKNTEKKDKLIEASILGQF